MATRWFSQCAGILPQDGGDSVLRAETAGLCDEQTFAAVPRKRTGYDAARRLESRDNDTRAERLHRPP